MGWDGTGQSLNERTLHDDYEVNGMGMMDDVNTDLVDVPTNQILARNVFRYR